MKTKRITPQIMYGVVGPRHDYPWGATMTYALSNAETYAKKCTRGSRVARLRVTEIPMPEARKPRAKKGKKRGKAT